MYPVHRQKKTKNKQKSVLTDTTGFISRPLVIVLACDGPFSHKFKGWLAKEGQHITMLKAITATTTKCWDPGITTASPFYLCKTHNIDNHVFMQIIHVNNDIVIRGYLFC